MPATPATNRRFLSWRWWRRCRERGTPLRLLTRLWLAALIVLISPLSIFYSVPVGASVGMIGLSGGRLVFRLLDQRQSKLPWFGSFDTPRPILSVPTPSWPPLKVDHGLTVATARCELWLLAIVAALPALVILARRLAWGHPDLGRCAHCHYDLRGVAPNAPCPECGQIGSAMRPRIRPNYTITRRSVRRRAALAAALLGLFILSCFYSARIDTPVGALSLLPANITLSVWRPGVGRGGFGFFELMIPKFSGGDWLMGVGWLPRMRDLGAGVYQIFLPLGPVIAYLVLDLLARAAVRRQRRLSGFCLGCGYDRLGLEPAVPCPECGRTQAQLPRSSAG
jgi:hypothetical protein